MRHKKCYDHFLSFLDFIKNSKKFNICILDNSECGKLSNKINSNLCCTDKGNGYADILIMCSRQCDGLSSTSNRNLSCRCILIESKLCIHSNKITQILDNIKRAILQLEKTPLANNCETFCENRYILVSSEIKSKLNNHIILNYLNKSGVSLLQYGQHGSQDLEILKELARCCR